MSGFNTSTKKEDVSVRLKAQNKFVNIKNAQAETKKLELESRKMEERLRELKVAMGREKEQREKQGGFWKKGQTGTLNSYASEVLEKSSHPKEPKKRGVKLLRDEKIVLPHRSAEPGTMKYIAESQQINNNKNKQLKCGQCEERSASVSCVQCSEYFCAGCFSAFHYKGALKRHRTVPLQASGPRQCMSPRVSAPPSHRSLGHGSEASAATLIYQSNDRSSPVGASGSVVKSSLLTGDYDEAESAASFQDALKAWRNGDTNVHSSRNKAVISKTSPGQPVSRVVTPTVMTETSTTTQVQYEPIEIKFKTHGVSYAERLLLKQHRRTDVENITISTPTSNMRYSEEDITEDDLEPVDFQSLYEAMVPTSTTPNSQHTTSSLSIIELDNTPKRKYRDVEQSSNYQVKEVSDMTAWAIQNSITSPTAQDVNSTSDTSSTTPSNDSSIISLIKQQENQKLKQNSNTKRDNSPLKSEINTDKLSIDNKEKLKQNSNSKRDNSPLKSEINTDKLSIDNKEKPFIRPHSRTKSSVSRHPNSARSRPASRAKSRAMSRMQTEGVLTKTPTPALHEIAKLAEREKTMDIKHEYKSVFDDFFTGTETTDKPPSRSTTPMLNNKKKDIKVSYTLYQMAPRSWKPENSFGENIPPEEAVLPELSKAILSCLSGDEGSEILKANHVNTETFEREASSLKQTMLKEAAEARQKYLQQEKQDLERVRTRNHGRLMDEDEVHEDMQPRRNKRTARHAKPHPLEKDFEDEIERELYSRGSNRNNTDMITPIRLDEISCKTETPQPLKSNHIEINGDDFSQYDVDIDNQTQDDEETLDKLEWELASESGRITADGKISRLSIKSDSRRNSSCSTVRNSYNSNDQGYDINTRLREDELVESDEDGVLTDRDDVRALH